MTTTPTPTRASNFRLLRYFTVISLISIIITSLLLDIWVRQISVDNLLKSEEGSNVALAQVLANSVWPQFHSHLLQSSNMSSEQLQKHAQTERLDKFINAQVEGLNILKIKIYDLNGYTIFSSDFDQIGKSKSTHESFLQAKSGKIISKLSFRDKFYAKKELIENRNVLASYIPVRPSENHNIEGVFEVYKDVTPLLTEIDNTHNKITYGVVGSLAILFFVLFFVVKRADTIIRAHSKAQEKVADDMRIVAFYDSLTGLPNRMLFMERLEHALEVAKRVNKLMVLMFIDLDRFKQVNDNLGHEAGDQLLCEVATRFQSCVRTGDTVSRISGDEFTILLENLTTIELATIIAQRILNKLVEPVQINQHKVQVGCSIGLSIYPFDDDNAESLVKKADAAMYFSKSSGRNNYHYYTPDMLKHGSHRYELESEISSAITDRQFKVFLQPKVDINDWTMHGMEALLRWQHPKRGMISPDEFIPILEETGKIIQVGEYILREACQQAQKWRKEGLPPLRLAVNVSALQIRQPGFYDMVCYILEESGMEPQYLELELTESCLLDDAQATIDLMHKLKRHGVRITIDDFGTGYSSLNYLSKLPVDALKIDRSFVRNITSNRESRSIVTAVISFAHGLNIEIVAEGIEDMQQLTFINAMRCTSVQGYIFSAPLCEEDFYRLYKSGGDFSYVLHNRQAENG